MWEELQKCRDRGEIIGVAWEFGVIGVREFGVKSAPSKSVRLTVQGHIGDAGEKARKGRNRHIERVFHG